MKTDILTDAVGMIRDDYIADAHSFTAKKRSRPFRTVVAVAAALTLTFAASLSAMAAADVDEAYRLMYALSPSVAQMLKPVCMSCEDNGVRMEVISADLNADEAYIYISMEDLIGDRIDSTIDLYDSYQINRNFDCAAGCELVNYDENTGKAMFLIHMQNMKEGEKIRGGKITFSVRELLSNKNVINEILPVDLTLAADNAPTQLVSPDRLRGTGFNGQWPESTLFLAPQEDGVYNTGAGAALTAMGYIDGRLHIQMRYDTYRDGKWYYDNHGFLQLLDENGEPAEMDCYEFWDGEMVTSRTDWQIMQRHQSFCQEYILDIPPEELSGYRLHADLWLCDTHMDGNWEVTFPLENDQ